MTDGASDPRLEICGTEVAWDLSAGTITSAGLRAALLWLDPSLLWLLAPLADELGVPLFRLLVAYNANIGADDDYHALIAGQEFSRGFRRWADVVSASGWGRFELASYDRRGLSARVVVHEPWELVMQRRLPPGKRWGCPFLQGKLIGLFFHAFAATCWADEEVADDGSHVVFTMTRSTRTIAHELAALRTARTDLQRREVSALLSQKTGELESLVVRQDQQLRRLSTPITKVVEGVVVVALAGVVGPQRVQRLVREIGERGVWGVILDLGGVDAGDAERAAAVMRTLELRGVSCALCGADAVVGGVGVYADVVAALAGLRERTGRSARA